MSPTRSLLLLAALAAVAAAQGAAVHLSHAEWDFGLREQGERDVLLVTVSNVGDAPLEISKVGVTCGCVSASITTKTISAGASAELKLDLDTSRQEGKIAKHVFLETNAPRQRRVQIPVKGEIVPIWWISTRTLNFGDVEQGSTAEQTLTISVMPGKDVRLEAIQSSTGWLTVDTVPFGELEGEHGYRVTVKLSGDFPIGAVRGSVLVRMRSEHKDMESLGAIARVLGPVIAEPQNLHFGAIESGKSKTADITITKRDGDGLKIEKITCIDDQIAIEIEETDPGRVFVLHVTCTPRPDMRRITGRLYVFLNEPEQKLVSAYYQAGVLP